MGCDADSFFKRVMRSTNTQILWPPKLKPGTKSKKDPHVRITGSPNSIRSAKEIIFEQLDTRRNRVTLKMDVAFTDHSHIIGKGGRSIQRVMDESGCHIHFPDSNRTNMAEKSNQVSIAGSAIGVEQSRCRIREMLPLTVQFDLPLNNGLHSPPTLDPQSSQLQSIQQSYGITIAFRYDSKCSNSYFASSGIITVAVRGARSHIFGLRQGINVLIEYLTGFSADAVNVPLTMNIDVAMHHHQFIEGRNNSNIRNIMQSTGAVIIMPEQPSVSGTCLSSASSSDALNSQASSMSDLTSAQNLNYSSDSGGFLPSGNQINMNSNNNNSNNDVESIINNSGNSANHQTFNGSNQNLAKAANSTRKTAIIIKGPNFESVYNAWQELLGCLPLILIFDLREGQDLDPVQVTQLMEQMRQISILIKPKQRQNTKSIVVRGPERDSRLLFEVRKRILDLDDSEVPVCCAKHAFKLQPCNKILSMILPQSASSQDQSQFNNLRPSVSLVNESSADLTTHLPNLHGQSPSIYELNNNFDLLNTLSLGSSSVSTKSQSGSFSQSPNFQPRNQQQQQSQSNQALFQALLAQQLVNQKQHQQIQSKQTDQSQQSVPLDILKNFEKRLYLQHRSSSNNYLDSSLNKFEARYSGFSYKGSQIQSGKSTVDGNLNNNIQIQSNKLSPQRSQPNIVDLDYDDFKLRAVKAVLSKPQFDKPRTPTPYWAGLGFSKSISEATSKDKFDGFAHSLRDNPLFTQSNLLDETSRRVSYSNESCSKLINALNPEYNLKSLMPIRESNTLATSNLDYQSASKQTMGSSFSDQNNNSISENNDDKLNISSNSCTTGKLSSNDTSSFVITEFLARVGLVQYVSLFSKHHIDLELLLTLTDKDLADLGISYVHRRKLAIAIAELKALQSDRIFSSLSSFEAAPGAERSKRQKADIIVKEEIEDLWSM